MPRPCEHNFLDYAFSRVVRACLGERAAFEAHDLLRAHASPQSVHLFLFFPLHGGHFLISKILPALPIYALPFLARLDQPLQRREAFSLPISAFILQDASRGGRASFRTIKSRGRREPGEWVGELTSCLTHLRERLFTMKPDKTNLLETNLLSADTPSLESFQVVAPTDFFSFFLLGPYYPGSTSSS